MAIDFNAIASAMPGMNEEVAGRQKAARDIMLQKQLGALPTQVNEKAASSQLATQAAAQSGQAALEQQQKAQQQGLQLQGAAAQQDDAAAKLSLQRTAATHDTSLQNLKQLRSEEAQLNDLESRKRVQEHEISVEDEIQVYGIEKDNNLQMATIQQRRDLANLGRSVKEQLLDSRLTFMKDESGRKFSNERQLRDYTIANARTGQEFASEMTKMQQDTDRYLLTLDTANRKLGQVLQQGYIHEKGDLDRASLLQIQELKNQNDKIARDKLRKSNNDKLVAGGLIVLAGAVIVATGGTAAPVLAPLAGNAMMAGGAAYAQPK